MCGGRGIEIALKMKYIFKGNSGAFLRRKNKDVLVKVISVCTSGNEEDWVHLQEYISKIIKNTSEISIQ